MHSFGSALQRHWRLYVDEGAELAIFMISACFFTVWLFDPAMAAPHLLPSSALRRLLMGISMGATAILIIRSPMGKRSGAHFNPAITLTYFRLGKIRKWDAGFYVVSQFVGGICGVGFSALCLRGSLAVPAVDFAVTVPAFTVPRSAGIVAAFGAEFFMAALLMLAVLWISNRPPLAQYTSYLVGLLIVFYVFVFAPVSGFSINPARTTGSAVFANVWTAAWLYFVAPPLGMMASAEIYLQVYGKQNVLCAKLHPDPDYPCPFFCNFPLHHHPHRDGLLVEAKHPQSPQERS